MNAKGIIAKASMARLIEAIKDNNVEVVEVSEVYLDDALPFDKKSDTQLDVLTIKWRLTQEASKNFERFVKRLKDCEILPTVYQGTCVPWTEENPRTTTYGYDTLQEYGLSEAMNEENNG